jgi:flagellum-specific peptidoglycan hydrolase FlgJ
MADENIELQRQMEELRLAMQGLNAVTNDAGSGLRTFTKELKDSPSQIVKGMAGFAKQVNQGDTGLKSLNAVIDVASNAVGGLAKAIPYVGEAMSALAKGVAEGAKILIDQLDATSKAFNDVAASGAAVSDGMSGLYRQFTTAGLSLQQFQKVVGENSIALARFRGVAGEGAEDFSKAVGDLTQGSDNSLRRLGMSAEDIGRTTGAFVTQQTRLGRAQAMDAKALTEGTKQYAMELDKLSKVTGLSREAIQKQQDAALSEARFRANIDEMNLQGRDKEAKALMTLQTRMQSFGAELGQGVRDLASGAANTDAARKMVASTGGAALDILARLKSGAIDQDQAQMELTEAYERQQNMLRNNAKFLGDTNESLNAYAQVSDLIAARQKGAWDKASLIQQSQVEQTDEMTNSTVTAQKNIEKMNIEMNKLAFSAMPAAAKATEKMTEAMTNMVKWVNEKLGVGTPVGTPTTSMTAPAGMDMGGAEVPTAGEATLTPAEMSRLSGPKGKEQQAYYDKMYASLLKSAQEQGLKNAEVIAQLGAAQASLETGYGKHMVGNNAFGIKARAGAPSTVASTKEFEGGRMVTKDQSFRTYSSVEESAADYIKFLKENKRYQGVLGATNLGEAISAQGKTGYATDPAYGQKLANIASRYAPSAMASNATLPTPTTNLSGPVGTYQPNMAVRTGPQVVSSASTATSPVSTNVTASDNRILMAQLDKLDEMVAVLKNQLSVSTRILQYSS